MAAVSQTQHDLLASYRDDFAKYSGHIPIARFNELINKIPMMVGNKFIYSHVNKDISTVAIKNALQLLTMARVCHRVDASTASGLPLAAGIKEKMFKIIFLDTGLVSSLLGLRLNQIEDIADLHLNNQGGLSEQVVGQLLRTIAPPYMSPELFYWSREQKNTNAEIDYLIQHQNSIIPIEVKSGSTGSLKSLHIFMAAKNLSRAVRLNMDLPSQVMVDVKTQMGEKVNYQLHSLPMYMIGQLYRLLQIS